MLEPPFSLSSPESRLLKFHTMSVCTSNTVRAAIKADRERRANLRAHEPPTIFTLRLRENHEIPFLKLHLHESHTTSPWALLLSG
ncbi:hypothetical protein SKAU_G00127290 [Synaphobranchus kaupii]|uniref:Uncharacterized protein n=1 Tax=Synaphobranchus kaupii TaxID=118154 RepID=A0A9Q1FPV5_SYNKA|nr:hypothetical protein SKAU_G00127290 [Synaphobranchus kaupii]